MIGVLICDDHRIVRQGIKQVLADAPEIRVVAEASDGQEALRLVTEKRVELHVVLLDIALPGLDGLEVLQQIKRSEPGLPVLMLSTYPERQYAVRCIKLGAAGYLNKSTDPDDTLAAVRKVAAGALTLRVTSLNRKVRRAPSRRRVRKAGFNQIISHRECS